MSSLPLPPQMSQTQQEGLLPPSASSSTPTGKKKRGGAPKAKGAVRAKSGCYTCRIRRKKCDEQPDRDGNCQTCVRLRLECLGFGAKRPDWMRENNSVQELREKIKQFLASQGMIKGHSGGGVRPADQDPSVLNLSTEPGPHGPGSAPSSSMSLNNDPHRQPPVRMPPMNVRDGSHLVQYQPLPPTGHPFPPSPPGQGVHMFLAMGHPEGSRSSPAVPPLVPAPQHPSSMVGSVPDHLDPNLAFLPYGQHPPPPPQQHQSSHPMSSVPASPWPSAPPLQPPSSFGKSYSIHIDEEGSPSEIVPTIPSEISYSPFPYIADRQDIAYVQHYMSNVLNVQYLLADPEPIQPFIFRFAQTSESALSAMCLLAAVHQQRMRQISYPQHSNPDTGEMDRLFRRTRTLLSNRSDYTEGDAMAGLHVVSCFLFTGGHGPWYNYLKVAMFWVGSILEDKKYGGPLEAYCRCTDSVKFIIRTTMWFDVWSAITRRVAPRFRQIYRKLFDGEHGYSGSQIAHVDMLPVMGCTNETVLAMSETATLAHWKDWHKETLSMPTLVDRGREIERKYLSRDHDARLDPMAVPADGLEQRRRLAANVFRASARVYLHSVLSGCRPHVEEIVQGVDETVEFLKLVPNSEGASRSVVRSVVLSIALCGCMTDNPKHRAYLSSCLVSLAGQEVEVLGNCTQAKKLMERVWEKRDGRDGGDSDVDWRDVIQDMSADLLLV